MATFATTGSAREHKSGRKRPGEVASCPAEPDLRGSKTLGELAVHRESLERLLLESPESLASILSALLAALSDHRTPTEVAAEEAEGNRMYALTEA